MESWRMLPGCSRVWPLIVSCAAGGLLAAPLAGEVLPPLAAAIEVVGELPNGYELQVSTSVPAGRGDPESRLRLTLTSSDDVRIAGSKDWEVQPVEPGREYRFTTRVALPRPGEGSVRLQAESFDARERRLWGRADSLFLLHTLDDRLHGRSSLFELVREKLARDRAAGRLDPAGYARDLDELMHGKRLGFEPPLKTPGEAVHRSRSRPAAAAGTSPAVVASTTVSGHVTYTPRTGLDPDHTDVFAFADKALPVRQATVEFFDQDGATLIPVTSVPAIVATDDAGAYSATVSGQRGDGSAVELVVRIDAINPAAKIVLPDPLGQWDKLWFKDSQPAAVSDAKTTMDVLVDSSGDLTPLRAFSILDTLLTAFRFVTDIRARTAVGNALQQLPVEFPGALAKSSRFRSDPDNHLNVGQNHAFDWDVLTHEYGHYVQQMNHTKKGPGGCHNPGSLTGRDQASCDDPPHVLTKQEGMQLAWKEAWPTFFGTSLQIASGAGALGIYGVADTRYTDTANDFSYDLETDEIVHDQGEDDEIAVQRILWDFADQAQDGHDELTYGIDKMWQLLQATDGTVVTLDAFRKALDGVIPESPAGYGTGSAEQNRARQGRIYFDHAVGPSPLAPDDNAALDPASPPTFRWNEFGGSVPIVRNYSYIPTFKVLFFTADYGQKLFESEEIDRVGGGGSWTPTAAQWSTIAAGPDGPNAVVKWVVESTDTDTVIPPRDAWPDTGPYRGLDRTLGAVDVAFVIDDTGSMSDAIAAVRVALTSYIAQIRAQQLAQNPLIEVITFKDEVTHRILSRDLDEIQTVVDALTAAGGGDCPESSGEALLDAVKNVGSGKTICSRPIPPPMRGSISPRSRRRLPPRGSPSPCCSAVTAPAGTPARGGRAEPLSAAPTTIRPTGPEASCRPGRMSTRTSPARTARWTPPSARRCRRTRWPWSATPRCRCRARWWPTRRSPRPRPPAASCSCPTSSWAIPCRSPTPSPTPRWRRRSRRSSPSSRAISMRAPRSTSRSWAAAPASTPTAGWRGAIPASTSTG